MRPLPFFIALQFLTIIPVQLPVMPTRADNAKSLLYYPLVGALIGLLLWAVAQASLPSVMHSALLLAAWVLITGGLHLDGLADTADGWVGGFGDRARTLEIMKDSHIGAMGVIAVVLLMMLKWAAIFELLGGEMAVAFVIVPILSRLAVPIFFATTPYIRAQGLGSALADTSKWQLWLLISWAVAVFWLPMPFALAGLAGFACVIWLLRAAFMRRLGGITGDTLGASIEIIETLLLLLWAAMM